MTATLSLPQSAAFTLLSLAIISIWFRPWIAIVLFGAATACGYLAGLLHGLAILWIVLFALACWGYCRLATTYRFLSATIFLAIGVGFGLHKLPGFHNPLVADGIVLSKGAEPYDLYLNFDKPLIGFFFLIFGGVALIRGRDDLRQAFPAALPLIFANIAIVIAGSFALGYVQFDPHWNSLFWVWALSNLLFTCMSEEVFFRAFLQQGIAEALNNTRTANFVAVIAASLLFGIAHVAGGWTYVALATLAGLGYGYIFHRTRRIEMSILAHFLMNTVHFLFFTYPRLA